MNKQKRLKDAPASVPRGRGKVQCARPPKRSAPSTGMVAAQMPPAVEVAKLKVQGVMLSAITTQLYNSEGGDVGGGDIVTLIQELRREVEASKRGKSSLADRLLIAQAVALDGVFNAMMQRAGQHVGSCAEVVERYMRLGLKAQAQCRTTLETLSKIKNPPNVAFVKQANIAHVQQSAGGGSPPAHAWNPRKAPNELLEVSDAGGQWMDAGAARAASSSNPALEAVGALHGPQDVEGESR